jgi:hypothetical protein
MAPQPVDHLHHALVVGIQLLGGLAQLDQLLEAGRRRDLAALLRRAHRLGQRIELGGVLAYVLRVGQHQLDVAAGMGLDLRHPAQVEGLGGGNDHLVAVHLHRKRAAAFGVVHRHHVGHPSDVGLERVDAQVGHVDAPCQPLGQRLGIESLRRAGAHQAGAPKAHQCMLARGAGAEATRHSLAVIHRDQLVVAQPAEQQFPVELALPWRMRKHQRVGHGGTRSAVRSGRVRHVVGLAIWAHGIKAPTAAACEATCAPADPRCRSGPRW